MTAKPKKDLSLTVALLSLVAIFAISGIMIAAKSAQDSRQAQKNAEETPQCNVDAGKLLEYVNQERSRLGAPQLAIDSTLAAASLYKLDNMVTEKYFSHKMPNGDEWHKKVRELGVRATVTENLGSNDYTPEQAWAEFKDSPNHYKSLIDPQYIRVGIATKCVDYTLEKVIEAGDEQYVGSKVTDLTVVTLAAKEPEVQKAAPQQPQVQQRTLPQSTHCTYRDYNGYFDPTLSCTNY